MIITTNDYNKPYNILGVVTCIKTMSLGLVKDFFAGIGEILGSNLSKIDKDYDTLRERAFKEIIDKATKYGGNAIIGLKMDFSQVTSPNGSGILILAVYGTIIQFINDTNQNNKGGKKIKTLKNKTVSKLHVKT